MLNNLVNNTDINGSYNKDKDMSCINDIFECIDKVQQQTNLNTKDLEKIKNNTSISCSEISSRSISSNTLSSVGIEADNIHTKSIDISNKASVKDIEASGFVKAESLTTKNITTENITGLRALTVGGELWADNAHTDNLEVSGNISSDSIQTNSTSTKSIDTDTVSAKKATADCVSSQCLVSDKVTIQNACVGTLSTENLASDVINVSKLTSTQNSISTPSVSTSGGIVGTGTIDVTSPVWKEIRLALFTGTVQFYTDEWKITITGGREFVWEDPSLEHLKFISNDGETVTVAVDWDGEVYYTYNVLKEPTITLIDNTGHTENNDHTFIMQDSGLPRGTVFIYQDRSFANQGIDILGKIKASNLEITCSQSVDCLSIEHLYIGSSLTSDTPIKVDICSRCFCIASPCTYISNCLYTNNIESDNICNKGNITTKDLCADNVNVKCEVNTTKVCSCDNVTEALYVNKCSEFHGPAYFYDNIYQCGETWCTHAQNVYTCSDTITMREGADFAGSAQIKVLKYDGVNNGVIYLGKDGTLRVGDEKNCQPVLTRSEEKDLSDGHGLVWDAKNKCAKDSGETIVSCAYVNCVGKACKESACCSAIAMDKLCLACSYAYTDTVCCNTISRDTLCLSCAKAYSDTKASCSCTYAGSVGTSCKACACAFAVTCGNAIGTACKNAAMATKANCYGNSYNCVQCSHIAKNVDPGAYNYPTKRFVYIGSTTDMSGNIGCNDNLWFCPGCNVLAMGGYDGATICLVSQGSASMAGDGTKYNPKIVFAATDNQCACLQYSQYDSVHRGAGLCWMSNQSSTWFDTDYVFANKFINRNGCQIGGYCATIPSPNGVDRYILLDFGAPEGVAYFSAHDNEGTIVKACTAIPYGKVYAQNTYGINGYCSLGTESAPNNCFWIRAFAHRNIYLWSKSPIKVVSNTTTNPGCTWQVPTIRPTCDYVNTVAGQCKSAACTYANTVAGQCKGVACTYAHCTVNSCKGIGVMGVARAINGNCWIKPGYWAYMTSSDGPTCCWSHVIKMDWNGSDVDIWSTGISIPAYNAPNYGIHYKYGCCGGHAGWKLIPNITCVQRTALSCGKASETLACAYADTIGTECYKKACNCALLIGTECKKDAYGCSLLIGTECKKDACAYADTVSFCNINVCRGISVIGTSTYCDSKCWGKDGNWTYLTFTEAPGNHWHYVMKMDGYEACRRAGFAFPADDYNQYGVYYKLGYDGGNDGWKLIPDIACVQRTALSCGKASETLACAYAEQCSKASCVWSMNCATSLVNTEKTNRKHDDALCLACSKAYTDTAALHACSFAVACVQKTTPDTSTFAKSYGGSTNCVQCAHKARNVELGNYTAAERRAVYIGNPISMNTNIGCNGNLWFCPGCNVLAMGSRDGATICLVSQGSASMAGDGTKYNPKIVFDSMDNQRGCLQYSQYDSVHEGAGMCWMTNQSSTWFDTDNMYVNTLTIRNGNGFKLGNYYIRIE